VGDDRAFADRGLQHIASCFGYVGAIGSTDHLTLQLGTEFIGPDDVTVSDSHRVGVAVRALRGVAAGHERHPLTPQTEPATMRLYPQVFNPLFGRRLQYFVALCPSEA